MNQLLELEPPRILEGALSRRKSRRCAARQVPTGKQREDLTARTLMVKVHELEGENCRLRRSLTEAIIQLNAARKQAAVAKKLLGARMQPPFPATESPVARSRRSSGYHASRQASQ